MNLRVKEILKERNKTLNELAEELGVSRQALSKQIGGKVLVETAEKIAMALNVPMWQLFASPKEASSDIDSSALRCPKCGTPLELKIKE